MAVVEKRKHSENRAEGQGVKKSEYVGRGKVQKTGMGALKHTCTCDTKGAWSLACALMGKTQLQVHEEPCVPSACNYGNDSFWQIGTCLPSS